MEGKFFRAGSTRFYLKGVAYGPFAPNAQGEPFPEPDQVERDLRQLRVLGANVLRVYDVPPGWLLDLAMPHGIRFLVDLPWSKHLLFLDSRELAREARETVRRAVTVCAGHPAIFAFSVVNEIPADIVRWSGTRRVEAFIEDLIVVAKDADPECLCTFASFPPTEFLQPRNTDFVCYNVYLHQREALRAYLARLQMLADAKPLVLGEFGLDALREGEQRQRDILGWQVETAFRSGLAGAVVFSYTDDWHRGGEPVTGWAFGLTTRDRRPRPSFYAVQEAFRAAPGFPLSRTPKVSVVVATYNGEKTLRTCLESLRRLRYPDYEVILVDDGSTDSTWEIAGQFPEVRRLRHENRGLSAARNTGLMAATGEIVAYTDCDCRVDEDWLYYLVGDLVDSGFVGVGGHNLPPPDDSPVAAAVMVSPGGPAHVMLDDREAEHLPGCNMAFYKWALTEIGGFDPLFRKAGDDVDVCWRLQQAGYKLGFSPSGFVWHYRRCSVTAYLKQQEGYGEAEALLARRHPEHCNGIGLSAWRGHIYTSSKLGVILKAPRIYRGPFGGAFFQHLYAAGPSHILMIPTALEYHCLVTLPLAAFSLVQPWLGVLAAVSLLLTVGICALAATQADLPPNKRRRWSRPLVAFLYLAQPIARGLARYRAQLCARGLPAPAAGGREQATPRSARDSATRRSYWSLGEVDRYRFLAAIIQRLDQGRWQFQWDPGWADHDLEILEARWSRLYLTTAAEQLDHGRLNLHCRLRTSSSALARVLVGALGLFLLLLLSLLIESSPWAWLLLLAIPGVLVYGLRDQAHLRRAVAALLDETAHGLKLAKLPAD